MHQLKSKKQKKKSKTNLTQFDSLFSTRRLLF
jgi:hypothetical protein